MKIFKYLLCLLLLVVAPQIGYCQIGKAVKQVSKIFMKKGAKEGAEATAKGAGKAVMKKTTEELAGEAAELSIKKNVGKSLTYDVMDASFKQEMLQLEKLGAEKLLRRKLSKEIAEKTSKGLMRQGDLVVAVPIENQVFRKMGTRESRQILEKSKRQELRLHKDKSAAQKAGIRAGKTFRGIEALNKLDDIPALKQLVSGFEKSLGPNYSLDKLVVHKSGNHTIVEFLETNSRIEMKGAKFFATAGNVPGNNALNEFLNHPLPNSTYLVDKYLTFTTDAKGRTIFMECHSSEMAKSVKRSSLARQNQIESVTNKDGKTGIHHSGHLQQHSTGGPDESFNMLPMNSELQRGGRWAKFEREEREAITAGYDVWTKRTISYGENGSYSIKSELKTIDKKTNKTKIQNKEFENISSEGEKASEKASSRSIAGGKEVGSSYKGKKLPANGSRGKWEGNRGDSEYLLNPESRPKNKNYSNPENKTVAELGADVGDPSPAIKYENGYPVFDRDYPAPGGKPMSISFDIKQCINEGEVVRKGGKDITRTKIHEKAYEEMARKYNMSVDELKVFKGDSEPVERLAKQWGCSESEVWARCNNPNKVQRVFHECEDGKTVQLVPRLYHDNADHVGGIEKVAKEILEKYSK